MKSLFFKFKLVVKDLIYKTALVRSILLVLLGILLLKNRLLLVVIASVRLSLSTYLGFI